MSLIHDRGMKNRAKRLDAHVCNVNTTVDFEYFPIMDDRGCIWPGKCVCGKKVYELYEPKPYLYDLKTNEVIS